MRPLIRLHFLMPNMLILCAAACFAAGVKLLFISAVFYTFHCMFHITFVSFTADSVVNGYFVVFSPASLHLTDRNCFPIERTRAKSWLETVASFHRSFFGQLGLCFTHRKSHSHSGESADWHNICIFCCVTPGGFAVSWRSKSSSSRRGGGWRAAGAKAKLGGCVIADNL